jgi:hypothetical protein
VVIAASDNVGVTRVELYLDDALIATDTSEPYSILWDSATVSNGSHTLLARAYDAAANVGPSLPITVVVENDATPPSPPALVLPADGIASTNPTPVFGWLDVDDPSGVRYRLQVDNSSGFSSPEIDVSDLESITYTPAQALGDGTYSWRVLAVDGAGNAGAWSEVRTLTIDTQPCSPDEPAVIVSPASQSANAGTTLEYSVSVTNTDSENCSSTNFSLNRTLPTGWTGMLSPNSLTLPPGQTGQATLSVSSADDAAPGNYGLNVATTDATGSTHNGSSDAEYTVLESPEDSEPPTAPTGLSAKAKGKNVGLSWNAATDNVGVIGYTVWRDGTPIGNAAKPSYLDNTVSAGATYIYQVEAYDEAGNTSALSNQVIITVQK